MAISVPDEVEGGKVVTRIERVLSRLGLVANSSKTKLITKSDFRESHFEEENECLEAIHQAVQAEELDAEVRKFFEEKLTKPKPR